MSTRTRLKDLERCLAAKRERKYPSTELLLAYPGEPGRDADGLRPEDAVCKREAEERGARIVIIRITPRTPGGNEGTPDAGLGVEKN